MLFVAHLSDCIVHACERRNERFVGSLVPLIGMHPLQDGGSPHEPGRPQAFLVRQAPGHALRVHCHPAQQFQLVTAGSGVIGKHPLQPVSLHYASRESGYGPLVAGEEGLDYYTIRAQGTRETWFLPDQRGRLTAGLHKRHAYGGPVPCSNDAQRRERCEPACELLLRAEDGAAAWMLRLPAGAPVAPEMAHAATTRFCYVASGGVQCEGRSLQAGDLVAEQGGSAAACMRAGDEGADMVIMQFPPVT